jgi:MerR family mercuric resistance operon transcriptional regulator
MARLTIGELARRAGVGVETVRYYQRRGLFPEPPRVARTTREYAPEALELLRFIRRARGLGFTIREVERLVLLRRSRKDARELITMIAAKATDLEKHVLETQDMVRELNEMAARCEAMPPADRWSLFDVAEAAK